MQVVHVLCAKKEPVAEIRLKLSQRNVRRIWLGRRSLLAALRIKLPNQGRILLERLGCADILNTMPRP